MADWKSIAKKVGKEVVKTGLDSMESTAKRQSKNKQWNDEQRDTWAGVSEQFGDMRRSLDDRDDRNDW